MQNQRSEFLAEELPRQDNRQKKQIKDLPSIPDKLYFTIGEASKLSLVKPHVLRYWEKEFSFILLPDKRQGGRRRYGRNDLLTIRRIRNLLYHQGFTIEGAKVQLSIPADNSWKLEQNQLIKRLLVGLKSILEILES